MKVVTDEFGRIYLPNIGWIITKLPNHSFEVTTNQDGSISLLEQVILVPFDFEGIELV